MTTAPCGNLPQGPGCLACGGPLAPARSDWCSRRCRAALRAYGSALEPAAGRGRQLERALAQRRALAAVGLALDETYRR